MNINLNNLEHLVARETLKVIRETLDSHLGDDNEERRRQGRMSQAVKKRDLRAADDKEETNEAEEEEVETETSEDESPEELEAQPTGVPDTIDKDAKETKPREDRTGGKGTKDSAKLDTPTAKQLAKPTVGAVIDKLNALRGGRSLKDPAVKKSFSQYFDSLTKNERESMLVFLTGLSQILAGVATGAEALDPGDVGLRVKDKPGDTEAAKEKAAVAKAADEQEKSGRPGTEAQPIVVGESQNKFYLKKMIEAYRRYE